MAPLQLFTLITNLLVAMAVVEIIGTVVHAVAPISRVLKETVAFIQVFLEQNLMILHLGPPDSLSSVKFILT